MIRLVRIGMVFGIVLLNSLWVHALEDEDIAQIQKEVADIPNPFLPQLPEKPKEVEQPVNPADDNKPDTTVRPKDPVRTVTPRPAVKTTPPPVPRPNFKVSGIIWNSDRPQAIINGTVVDVGDKVGEFKIESITQNEIGVSVNGTHLKVNP